MQPIVTEGPSSLPSVCHDRQLWKNG